ncbi:MAG: group III truncated hemoglobin [Planctomycetota bacterium]|nr:group III truncated hemoglobin [Planctomycetota bacterium]
MQPDLDNRGEITRLVETFYKQVDKDDVLGPIFNGLAEVDWEEHTPKLTAFWCQLALGQSGFKGNPAAKHIHFSALQQFTTLHFDRWITLFHATIDGAWAGPYATAIKDRAVTIAEIQANLVGARGWQAPG